MKTLHAMRAIAANTLLEALRSRLHWLLLLLGVCAIGLGGLLQQLALTETRETQALLLGAGLRLAASGVVASFVVTSMVREAQDGSLQLLLALPIARGAWLAGRALGFAAFALLAAAWCALPCLPFAAAGDVGAWAAALALELLVVAAFAAFAALSLRHPVPALALVAAFYLLARSANTLALLGRDASGSGMLHGLGKVLDALVLLLPRLDSFARADWLAYGSSQAALPALCGQALLYIVLLLAAATFDLRRKEL